MNVRVLGELVVEVGGRRVDLGPARQRCVWAALVVEVNHVVSVQRLVERVWGVDAPVRARQTLLTYLSRLRQVLADVDAVELVRRSGGYLLVVEETDVDLCRFRDLVDRARGADAAEAVRLLTEASGLWRGEPLPGLTGDWAAAERDRLVRERLAAEHDLVGARLRVGEGGELVAELSTRAAAHPLDERVACQYMLALHRAGRTAEALEHYRRIRQRLVSELGADPSPQLQELHRRILDADPTLATPSAGEGVQSITLRLTDAAAPRHATEPETTDATTATRSAGGSGCDSPSGGATPGPDLVREFAASMQALKVRSGLSYQELADRAELSRSTLHRYCTGRGLPADVQAVTRLARVCGASETEAVALVRAWRPADAVRHHPPVALDDERAPAPVLRNDLPRDISDFVARDEELDWLLTPPPPHGPTAVKAIDGMAGVGKTTLAVHAAHRLSDRYPDGQLFLDLHGHTAGVPPMSTADALAALLRAADVPHGRIPGPVEQRVSLWRSTLAGRRTLVVLDNAADTAQVTPLLPGEPHCLVLITSRGRLTDLDAVGTLTLDVLATDDGVDLFDRVVGPDADRHDRLAVAETVRLCGRLPLAIRIAAARLRHHPAWTTDRLNRGLRTERRRLAELRSGGRSVEAAFALSYGRLTAQQQRMFRLIGLHPGTDVDPAAAAEMAELSCDQAEDLLEQLVDAHVLHQVGADRYRYHDLVRDHARALAATDEPDAVAATRRLLDHVLRAADRAAVLLEPSRRPERLPLAGEPRHAPAFRDQNEAVDWLDRERTTLVAAIALAHRTEHDVHCWQLARALWHFFRLRGHVEDWVHTHSHALASARRCGDRRAEAETLKNLGVAKWLGGDTRAGVEDHESALAIDLEIGDACGEAKTTTHLGFIHSRLGDHQRAADNFARSARLYRQLDDPTGIGRALAGQGDALRRMGEPTAALPLLAEALSLSAECGDHWGETLACAGLGFLCLDDGRTAPAGRYLRRALAISRRTGDRWSETLAAVGLGSVHLARGEEQPARRCFEQALLSSRQSGDRRGEGLATEGLHACATGTPSHWQARHLSGQPSDALGSNAH